MSFPHDAPEWRQIVCGPDTEPGAGENFTLPLVPPSGDTGASVVPGASVTTGASVEAVESLPPSFVPVPRFAPEPPAQAMLARTPSGRSARTVRGRINPTL